MPAHSVLGDPMWASSPILPSIPKMNDSCPPELEISLGTSGNLPLEDDLLFPELEGLSQELGEAAQLVPEICKVDVQVSPKLQSKPAATTVATVPYDNTQTSTMTTSQQSRKLPELIPTAPTASSTIPSLMDIPTQISANPRRIHEMLMDFHDKMMQLPAPQRHTTVSPIIEESNSRYRVIKMSAVLPGNIPIKTEIEEIEPAAYRSNRWY